MRFDDLGQLDIELRRATADDVDFIVEMARHACVIEDWPLPDSTSEETRSLLPAEGDVAIVATDATGTRCGAVWTLHHDPPLMVDASPEVVIAVTPGKRGNGIGGALLDELVAHCIGTYDALCLNVHQRNPAVKLYRRKAFRDVGQGRGALGIAMRRDLR